MRPLLFSTFPGLTRRRLLADILAGTTVALVALPLSLAIAIASGAPPASGLVTAIVAGALISLFGGSRVQIGGPTGAFIVVVYGVIADHGHDGLVLATLMAGVILTLAGLLRMGRLIAHVPEAVVTGFTIGIGVIIATSQVADFAGMRTGGPVPADFLEKLPVLWEARATISPAALGIGVGTIAMIVVLRRAAPRLPGLVLAMAVASGLALWAGLDVDTIAGRFGDLPAALPMPALPEITLARMVMLLPSALVIAFLAGVESLLSAMVADRMIHARHRPNAEILAQGYANIGSALFGGLPATGAIARTATNIAAGGRSPVAGLVHAGVLLAIMLAAAPLAGQMVMPALAALLILTAWNMSEPHRLRAHLTTGPLPERGLLVLTAVLTVIADLTVAIGLGVALGLALRLARRGPPSAGWTPPER